MNRLTLLPLLAAPLLAVAPAVPAAAQDAAQAGPADNPNERVNQLIIYGDDPCPKSKPGEITVCARKPESERFRIPEDLRNEPSPSTEAWTNKVESYETVGNFGNNSCSPSGYGGWTGCTQALIDAAYQEDKTGKAVQFSELIAKARAERAGKIDEQAAQEQARVEQAEKDYAARQKADAGTAGDDTDTGD
ncbi:MAG TPA: hypothetical protein VF418_03635 [Sphingomonadaceae bacterium]